MYQYINMDKKYYITIGILVILLLIFTVPKYFVGNVTASGIEISGDVERIEVFHFHATSPWGRLRPVCSIAMGF